MKAWKKQESDQFKRQKLIHWVLWGDYSQIGCLPETERRVVDYLAEDPFINFDRLAVMKGEADG